MLNMEDQTLKILPFLQNQEIFLIISLAYKGLCQYFVIPSAEHLLEDDPERLATAAFIVNDQQVLHEQGTPRACR